MKHRVGAQTIVWGDDIRAQMPRIIEFLAAEGYSGVETGMRHFDPEKPGYYRELYAKNGIHPLGLHSGGTFWDLRQAAEEMEKIGKSVEFAAAVGFDYVVISGNPNETVSSMKKSAETYREIGAHCREAGLRMAYHNHNWELKEDGAIIDVLMNATSAEEVLWVLDTAWANIAGMDLPVLFDRYGDRFAYLHVKDAEGETFCELGTGNLDFDETLHLADRFGIDWLVVEQDYSSLSPEESMRTNIEFIRKSGGLEV